jgi:hypothetical protein
VRFDQPVLDVGGVAVLEAEHVGQVAQADLEAEAAVAHLVQVAVEALAQRAGKRKVECGVERLGVAALVALHQRQTEPGDGQL